MHCRCCCCCARGALSRTSNALPGYRCATCAFTIARCSSKRCAIVRLAMFALPCVHTLTTNRRPIEWWFSVSCGRRAWCEQRLMPRDRRAIAAHRPLPLPCGVALLVRPAVLSASRTVVRTLASATCRQSTATRSALCVAVSVRMDRSLCMPRRRARAAHLWPFGAPAALSHVSRGVCGVPRATLFRHT